MVELARAKADKAAYIREKVAERERGRQLLRVWAEEYLGLMERAGKRDIRRRRGCVAALVVRFEDKAISEITRRDMEAWRDSPQDRLGPASVNRHLAYASHLFSEAIKRGHLEQNPLRGVARLKEPPGRVRYLEPEEAEKLLDACEPWFRPILALALETGCRKGELLNLRWADVDFRAGFLHVRHSKNGEARSIPLTPRAREALASLPRALHHPYVFSGRTGKPLVRGWDRPENRDRDGTPLPGLEYNNRPLYVALKRACEAAGIEDFVFHSARHHVGSWLAMTGVSLDARMALLGHKTARMAHRYTHLSPDYLKGAMERFSSGTSISKSATEVSGAPQKVISRR